GMVLAAARPVPIEGPMVNPAPAKEAATLNADDGLLWRGRVAPGATFEVRGFYGDVRAALTFGEQAEVRVRTPLPAGTRVEVRHVGRDVRLCVLYEAARGRLDTCDPPQDWTLEHHGTVARVDLDVRLPFGVGLAATLWKGDLHTTTLTGPIFARTLDGSLHMRTSQWAEGSTANGNVFAELGELNTGRNALEFHSLNGNVTVELPKDADVNLELISGVDRITSDVPLARRREADGTHATGRLRQGRTYVQLLSPRGQTRLRLVDEGSTPDPDPDLSPDPDPDPNVDPAANVNPNPDPQPPDPGPQPDPDPFPSPSVTSRPATSADWPPMEAPPQPVGFDPTRSVRALPSDARDMDAWKRVRDAARRGNRGAQDFIVERATWALGRAADGSVVGAWIDALQEEDWRVREAASWALGLAGDARAAEPLRRALGDDNGRVRANAAQALGQLRDRQAVPTLSSLARDPAWQVRYAAVEALGEIGDRRAADVVQAALSDSHIAVREAARQAAARLGS
ncbi:MAG TPA: HEAT repeat domain-containing protein, partial [Rhodothermales bacterium]|nr:HEAT repeat domain-containing protein [Rhodothermales bacterium]